MLVGTVPEKRKNMWKRKKNFRERTCVLLLQDLLQSCARGGRRRVEDMCYERRRAEACVDESAQHATLELKKKSVFGGLWFVDSWFHKTALAL
jgi:hypothetical protein